MPRKKLKKKNKQKLTPKFDFSDFITFTFSQTKPFNANVQRHANITIDYVSDDNTRNIIRNSKRKSNRPSFAVVLLRFVQSNCFQRYTIHVTLFENFVAPLRLSVQIPLSARNLFVLPSSVYLFPSSKYFAPILKNNARFEIYQFHFDKFRAANINFNVSMSYYSTYVRETLTRFV